MIISLYAGGMTIRDIQHHLVSTIGTELSHETISKVTDAVLEEVKAWQAHPLEEIYPIVYLDALVVKVRERHQVRNRAAHIAVGVDLDGVKHALGIWVQAVEGANFWARCVRQAPQPRRARRARRVLRTGSPDSRGDRGNLAADDGPDLINRHCVVAGWSRRSPRHRERTYADACPWRPSCGPVPSGGGGSGSGQRELRFERRDEVPARPAVR
jgi:hypothetical protein